MQHLSPEGRSAVSDIASRFNISVEAVEHMLIAVNNGAGHMAQFNCPELGGSGQWMRGGMVMVGDMFNHGLKSTVDNLCTELSNLLGSVRVFPETPAGTTGSKQWWQADLGTPFSSGSQNSTRYAVFAGRLAVEVDGQVTIYDTLDHQIGGVSQQQASSSSLTFNSQFGTIQVSTLPVVSIEGASFAPDTNFVDSQTRNIEAADSTATTAETAGTVAPPGSVSPAPPEPKLPAPPQVQVQVSDSGNEIIALIEKLAQLHGAGVLNDEEFSAKKQELLARL